MTPQALKGAPLPDTPISTVLVVIALQAEALPLVADLALQQDAKSGFPVGVPWMKFSGEYKGLNIHVVTPGVDPKHGVDSVGTVPAALLTFSCIQALKPDLIINCGTAGGFQAKGAEIADVYLVTGSAFHDRRNPIAEYHSYALGTLKATPVPKLLEDLQLKAGVLTTGDSLDHTSEDVVIMTANDATVKDMEGAAIAYVADMCSVPLIMLKGVTDIVDSPAATAAEFLENLSHTCVAIQKKVSQTLQYLSGKKLSDLQ